MRTPYGATVDGALDPRELRVSDAEREHVGTLLQLSFSSVHNSVGGGPPHGTPHVVLHGAVRVGSVSVRWSSRRRLHTLLGH